MLAQPIPHHTYDVYAGQNAVLAASAQTTQPLAIGVGFTTDLDSSALFGSPLTSRDGTIRHYLAAIASIDAVALRLQVDVSALGPEDSVYVIDPLGPRAYGPYTAEDMVADGRWLPTVEGDTAVLLVQTPSDDVPQVRLVGVSHIYQRVEDVKELNCNLNAACINDPEIAEVRAAVGIMVRTTVSGDSALCSGTLINNPDTPENEPYYITANHCVPGAASAQQVDIIWDFRTVSCLVGTPPALSSLPRSNAIALLETNRSLDISLLELDDVPSGEYGRTYVGWDTRVPQIGENVVGIHHPDGKYMRVSYGDVTAINQPAFGSLPYIKQTEVQWAQGVTEGGSSGSCLLFENDARLMGTLSNGPVHSCSDISRNKDRYASFRDFFPQIEQYLTGGGVDGPVIQLSETSHSFGAVHDPWVLQISNANAGSTLSFTVGNVPAWLNASPTKGTSTGPANIKAVTFTVTPDALSPGFNVATIQITAPGAESRSVSVSALGPKMLGCYGGPSGTAAAMLGDIALALLAIVCLAWAGRPYCVR